MFHHLSQTRNKSKKTSNSFEFTSYWADANNKVINDLVDFTRTFLSKHAILISLWYLFIWLNASFNATPRLFNSTWTKGSPFTSIDQFSDSEWTRFFNNSIANKNDGIVEKTRKIQEDYMKI